MRRLLESSHTLIVISYFSSALILLFLLVTIIKNRESYKVLLRIRGTVTGRDIGKAVLLSLGAGLPIYAQYLEYKNYLNIYDFLKRHISEGLLSPKEHFEQSCAISSVYLTLMIWAFYKSIYDKSVLTDITIDGIRINGFVRKWRNIESTSWEENKLILKVRQRFLVFKRTSDMQVEIPEEEKQHVETYLQDMGILDHRKS